MRRHLERAALVAAGLLAPGCTDDAPEAARHPLGPNVVIDVGADGRVGVLHGDRALVALSATGPEASTFDLVADDLFGQWRFRREGESLRRFARFAGSEAGADAVVVRYAAEDGSEARLSFALDGDLVGITLDADAAYDALRLPVECDAAASFYGWGEQYNAGDQRGEVFDLFVEEQGIGRTGSPDVLSTSGHAHSTYYPMPYYLDARGHGLLVETDYRTIADVCATDPAVAWLDVEAAEPLSAVVFPGPTAPDVIRALGQRVGRPKAPPAWAYGLWVGIQGGTDAVLAEADALEAAGITATALWAQDWTGPRQNVGGGFGVQYRWVADTAHYPDLGGMIDTLHGRGYRFLAYANPFVMPNLPDHFATMDQEGWLLGDGMGGTLLHGSPAGDASHPDLTNEASREYVKSQLRAMVTDLGIDGWMADFAEWVPIEATLSDGRDARAYHNRYPEDWHRLSREVMDELRPDGDWAVFSRSGWTGQQSVAQIVWCGDQEATFEEGDGLPTVVPCMLNLGLSGVPFVTHDIAGFSGGPSTKELYLRWVELGAFTPVMRTHEGNEKETNWNWDGDAETIAHVRRFAAVHDRLAPELIALADEAATTSMPIVRHLMLAYPDDADARAVDDQYLLGPDLLVAPVVHEGATTRSVYLPAGTWFDVWSGESFEGPLRLDVDAPLGRPPVFSRGADRDDLRTIP